MRPLEDKVALLSTENDRLRRDLEDARIRINRDSVS